MTDPPVHLAERYGPFAAMGLVVIGLILRVHGLSEYWVNADEGIYYSTLTQPCFEAFWSEVMANAHPPAFYLLLRGLGYLTWDFVALRWVPLLFGVAAVWAFWLAGRELAGGGMGGGVAGLVAAAWLAVSPDAIVLSQVLRPYTMVVFLLAAALVTLLRYRREPASGRLVAYATLLALAVLTHYSAALALGALSLLVLHDAVTGRLAGRPLGSLLAAHTVPCLLFVCLYLVHVSSTLQSPLMDQALGAGGWIETWLIDSPADAWRSFVGLQNYHLPPAMRVRSALLLFAVIAVAAVSRGGRPVAILTGGALVIAVAVSALGLYPLGPSRHSAWLTVFTLPALGWLAARIATAPRSRALLGVLAVAVLMVGGIPLEGALAGSDTPASDVRTNQTEEQVVRRIELAPLVVERMEPDDLPRWVLMTEQSYYVLMPLFAPYRDASPSAGPSGATSPVDSASAVDSTSSGESASAADAGLIRLDYGRRSIVVVPMWDWSDPREMRRWVGALPEMVPELGAAPDRVLVLAGGWGSPVIPTLPSLVRDGVVLEHTMVVTRSDPHRRTIRMVAMVVDPAAATGSDVR